VSKLQIAEGLSLPLEISTERSAFIGRTGQGKSYAAQKLAELLHAAHVQFVVLDPVGIWWGLRLAANGKDPGLENVPVLGGLHGDLPLEATAGKVIADLAVDEGRSMVLDVSGFEYDTDRNKFARDFGERLFFRKKSSPSAMLIFLEEGQEFVPQEPGPKENEMLRAYTRLAKIGRNFGVGISLITQRPQEVSKKVLNLTELLFAFQLNGKHERTAVEKWIEDKAIDEDIGAELPKLKPWHPHAWSPSWLGISKVVRILPRWTFDASSTPKAGAVAGTLRPLGPIDKAKLERQMAATVAKAKAEDPKELRRQVAERDKTIRELQQVNARHASAAPATKEKRVEVPVLQDGQLAKVERLLAGVAVLPDRITAALHPLVSISGDIAKALGKLNGNGHRTPIAPREHNRPALARGAVPVSTSTGRGGEENRLGAGERRVLTAIAQHQDGVTREQLTVLTGYKRSSRDTYLQRLSAAGLALVGGTLIFVTPDGLAALGPDFEVLPTGDDLLEYWLGRLPEGERKILAILTQDAGGDTVDRETISEQTGYKRSSRDTYLQRLSARRLIVTQRDGVRASETLFG
jgi:uncharacterized protein